ALYVGAAGSMRVRFADGTEHTYAALAAGLGLTGHYGGGAAAVSLAMLAPALAGMVCGQRLRHALSPQRFRLCLYASLALLGAYQIVQARW
ncbi:sulfite exporter TauE/SafE family protein, partial [Bordetella bronchiseptica]